MQYAGLKALALKVSSFLVAKKSFRFHFFCNLVSGKLFLLSAVFNRTFRCKSPHIAKPFPVVCNIFSELTPKASLLFFQKTFSWNYYRKILRDIWKPNRTLSINFVLKIRFRENPLWNENLKPNVAWKFTLHDNPNFADKRCV